MKTGQVLEQLAKPDIRLVMVIGGADSGKTTLIEEIADALSQEAVIGIVDADIGQSHLGPPATVACGRVKGGFGGWDSIPVDGFYFTGAVSPPGNLLPLTVGTKLMADRALAACDKVLVDTTGLVEEPIGRVLKQQKIDILMPDMLIALQRQDELTPILDPLRFQKKPAVLTLPVPVWTKRKSVSERARYRQERFRSYFKDARIAEFLSEKTSFRFLRGEEGVSLSSLGDRLVALRDEENTDLALGVIEAWDPSGKRLMVKTSLMDTGKVATMVIGTVNVTP